MATVPDTTPPVAPKLITDTNYNWTVDPQITMTTNYGTVVIELQPQQAPVTVANMLAYVNSGFYTDVIFHRVMSGFMIQAGLVGVSGNQYFIKSAIYSPINIESNNGLANLAGTIAMARTTDPNSASAQFFINQVDNAFLNYTSVASPGYAVFGKVLSGMSVVNSISKVTTTSVNAGSQGTLENFPNSAVLISSIQQTISGGAFSRTGLLNVSDVETGAHWDYSINAGATWISGINSSFTLPSGSYSANSIEIRQTDASGNISKTINKLTSNLIVDKDVPTLTILADSVTSGSENVSNIITFASIKSHSDAVDTDGEVTGFVVKNVSSGTLVIGTSIKDATAWNALTNNTIDAYHQAYWKPDLNATGVLSAFNVVAQDNGGLLSEVAIQTTINVIAQSAAPVLTQPLDLNYVDTKFDDSYATFKGILKAIDTPTKSLIYSIDGGTANSQGFMSLTNDYGTLSLNTKTGAYTYVPIKSVIDRLKESVIASFTITVSDGALSDTKKLYINITQQGITESNGDDVLLGNSGNEKFNGLAGNDIIDGGVGADTLIGGLGADTLIGGLGADSLIGGSGDDVYFVDNAGDKVIEKVGVDEGVDSVKSTISYNLGPNVENLTLLGDVKINAKGNAVNNLIIGNAQANKISGGSGNDTINGGAGNDTILGGVGDDSIFGENGDDTLTGDAGNDLIVGGDGKDVLKGGAGSDTFWFDATPNATTNVDTLTDFVSGTDKLQFSLTVLPELNSTGNFTINDARFISNTTDSATAPENRFIYNYNTGTLYYDADGSALSALPVAIELLGAHKVLSATDIIVV
ncbi:MAG: peptidylprolyl isomerase [Methylococcales bacterium]|nr:peptidylprolyl isomerase [Methylococcales bacterium]